MILKGENLENLRQLVEQNIGMTLLPHLASDILDFSSEQAKLIEFAPPVPTRQISLLFSQSKLKEHLILLRHEEIVRAVPENLLSATIQQILDR